MSKKILIRTDKNGTKYYQAVVDCDRCQGRGWFATGTCNGQLVPARPDDAVCYKCGGSGKVVETVKEYTPEYAAKLAERREKAAAKKAAQVEAQRKEQMESNRAASLKQNGFSQDGVTFLFLGDTFDLKDEIKAVGGKFDGTIGWHIDHPVDGFQFLQIQFDEVAEFSVWGWVQIKANKQDIDGRKKEAMNKLNGVKPSEYIGIVGQKISVEASLIRHASYDVRFAKGMWGTSTVNVYTFADANGNLIVWKTSTYIDMRGEDDRYTPIKKGDRVLITGTVKELSEYKGEKQTVLTRCKVVAA